MVFKAGYQHFSSALTGCMNKIIVIDINADMGKRLAVGIKEDQIAGMKILFRNLIQRLGHSLNRARQRYALMLVDMLNKSAAIETLRR